LDPACNDSADIKNVNDAQVGTEDPIAIVKAKSTIIFIVETNTGFEL